MRLSRTFSLFALVSPFALFGACSVDTDGLIFDDDDFANASGDGDLGGASGDGDGDGDLGGAPGDGDGDAPVECTMVGELQCVGKQVQVCDGSQFIDVGPACDFICAEGACSGECAPGTNACDSGTTQIACDAAGQWAAPTTCQFACVGDECDGECTPGARDCGPDGERRLCDDNGSWTDQGVCSAGACEDGDCTACTVVEETQCTPDGKLQTCDGTNWDEGVGCPFVCLSSDSGDDECGGVCVPESERCVGSAGNQGRQFCNSSGAWEKGEECNFVCIELSGGATECGGQCVPGEVDCVDNRIVECDKSGKLQEVEDCDTGSQICSSSGGTPECVTPKICKPDATRCNIRLIETCNDKGTEWETTAKCTASGELCYDGACISDPKKYCSGFKEGSGCVDEDTEWACSKGTFQQQDCRRSETCGPTSCSGGIRF